MNKNAPWLLYSLSLLLLILLASTLRSTPGSRWANFQQALGAGSRLHYFLRIHYVIAAGVLFPFRDAAMDPENTLSAYLGGMYDLSKTGAALSTFAAVFLWLTMTFLSNAIAHSAGDRFGGITLPPSLLQNRVSTAWPQLSDITFCFMIFYGLAIGNMMWAVLGSGHAVSAILGLIVAIVCALAVALGPILFT